MTGKRKALLTLLACVLAIACAPVLAYAESGSNNDGAASNLVAGAPTWGETASSDAGSSFVASATTKVFTIGSDESFVEADSIYEALLTAGADPADGPSAAYVDENELSVQADDGFVIVLDPGHGGTDSGATGNGLEERSVNLAIAQYCKAALERTPGVTVYMTRTDDTYVSLQGRIDFAVSHNADLVVSIHNNSGGGSGSEVIVPREGTWLYETTYKTGTELGARILAKLNGLGLGTHSGVYSRDCTTGDTYPDGTLDDYYALVRGPRANGILGIIVEHAFIDDAGDASYLSSETSLQSLGEADAQAILEYYDSSEAIDRLYWSIFDLDYYLSNNPDVQAAVGTSKLKALGHFKGFGMSETRRGNVLFDVNYYKANNDDLRYSFGDNSPRYYLHFKEFGVNEGRQGCAEFSAKYYKANYADLRQAFGSNWPKYYRHYLEFGMAEGRVADRLLDDASSDDEGGDVEAPAMHRLYNSNSGEHFYTSDDNERTFLIDEGWVYEGVAWYAPATSSSPVYRLYNSYVGDHHYTLSKSESDALVDEGWTYEGVAWYSDDDRGAPLYRLYNPNAETGSHHYTPSANERDTLVDLGWRYEDVAWYGLAGSAVAQGVSTTDEAIMGASQTTVDQMVRRYNSMGKAYPAGVYTQYGAESIDRFCEILYEEAAAEGVRAEVVFAQAMHETGWLQYGGDVSADQCNFAGIGATGGVPGNSFNTYGTDSVRMGLRAQVQHLKAYASTSPLNNETVDPRFTYVTRGCAPTVEALSGKWATGSSYGAALISQIRALLGA